MKSISATALIIILISCVDNKKSGLNLEGTWQLVSGTIIEKGDTTVTDYTSVHQMVKVINKTHFAFLNHGMTHGKDSTALFVAGGGRYELNGDQYTEYLEYCSDRSWEDHDFQFTMKVRNDTLIQSGIEKVEGAGVNRLNIEKYFRVKN